MNYYYYEGVKTSPNLDKSKRTNGVVSQRSIRFTTQKKTPEDPLLIWRPNFFIHRPPKLLFSKFLNGELSGSDLLSKTNAYSCQSKKTQENCSPQRQKNKMHVLKHFLTERIKRRSTNIGSKLGETLNDSLKQPIKLCNQQKQLKEQLLLYRLQPQQQQEYYNVNLKTRVFDECNELFKNQSKQKQEESIQQLKKSKKVLFSKLNKAKILSVKPEFTPMNHQNVTIQDIKLFNYLTMSNETKNLENSTSFFTPQQNSNNHFRRSCKEQDILKNQKVNETEEVESVSDNRSLQSQYEYHLDDLVQKQQRIEQRYSTSTKRLDQTIRTITKLKEINKEAFFTTKSKLKI